MNNILKLFLLGGFIFLSFSCEKKTASIGDDLGDGGVAINEKISGSNFITPENIAMALAILLDVDMSKFDAYPESTKAIKQILV